MGEWQGTNATLATCPANFYCQEGIAIACPHKSVSNAGSKTRADCYCSEGYYGSLGAPNTNCKVKPPSMNCSTSTCTCPTGWRSTYVTIGDYTAQKCLSSCAIGYYTEVDNRTMNKLGCTKCPRNTYADHQEATRAADCTPCPSGFITLQVFISHSFSFVIRLRAYFR